MEKLLFCFITVGVSFVMAQKGANNKVCIMNTQEDEDGYLKECMSKYFTDAANTTMMDGNVGVTFTKTGVTNTPGTCYRREDSNGNILAAQLTLPRMKAQAIKQWNEGNCGSGGRHQAQAKGTCEASDKSVQIESVHEFYEDTLACPRTGCTQTFSLLVTNGIPDHCYNIGAEEENNNEACELYTAIFYPNTPTQGSFTEKGGQNGFTKAGGFLYKHTSAEDFCNAAAVTERPNMDFCDGHNDGNNRYHHHKMPNCREGTFSASGHVPMKNCEHVGWSPDGYKIYAKCSYRRASRPNGQIFTLQSCFDRNANANGCSADNHYTFSTSCTGNEALDEANGHTFAFPAAASDDTSITFAKDEYAYFFTDEYPFIPRGKMGVYDDNDWCMINVTAAIENFDVNGNAISG